MRDLLKANTVRQRIRGLRKFVEFWYGPHQVDFELRDPDERLPLALRLFFRHNAYRRCLRPKRHGYYQPPGDNYLLYPNQLCIRSSRRFEFLREDPGGEGWIVYTSTNGDDPNVVMKGRLPSTPTHKTFKRATRTLSTTLSRFLVTHILVTAIYRGAESNVKSENAADRIKCDTSEMTLIWDALELMDPYCPYYPGKVYLWRSSLLVHQTPNNHLVFASRPHDE